jgi:hypothetical protein
VEIAYVGKSEGFKQCSTEEIETYLKRADTVRKTLEFDQPSLFSYLTPLVRTSWPDGNRKLIKTHLSKSIILEKKSCCETTEAKE